jgi:tRNA G10  N-methylase Trm11
MKQYLFFLGRNLNLGYKELSYVFKEDVIRFTETIFMVSTDVDVKKYQNQLGSIIKIAEVIQLDLHEQDICHVSADYLYNFFFKESHVVKDDTTDKNSQKLGKCVFALNAYAIKKEKTFLKKKLMGIKKCSSFPLRFCNKDSENIRSVVTFKEIIKKNNIELNVIKNKNQQGEDVTFVFSKTISCQNIDFYSKRDYEKPFRDAKVGMLPPKLAQMLINFAPQESQVIWDPFCGLGTIPIEALLMDKKAIASDISHTMVQSTQNNVEWLSSQNIPLGFYSDDFGSQQSFSCFPHDATKPFDSQQVLKSMNRSGQKIDAIVTESYLGPALHSEPSEDVYMETDEYISNIYKDLFYHASEAEISCIVICVPAYRVNKSLKYMQKALEVIQDSPYEIEPLSDHERQSLVYSRPDNIVCREIFKLKLL